ncbi:hypothetical protein M405DRAFT_628879 [Rhizopogon salebrosus TDB-379]|nr:hypothetical protein M405DRAFT_628879 [Rhizopogon salebrosus TDB-379]
MHTRVPREPPVSATQVEGIPVCQTTLPHANTTRVLLRRPDTDFVHLTHLLAVFCSCPMLHPSATHVTHPNPSVSGTWAPLSTARHFLSQCPATPLRVGVEVFLSDKLVMRFPSASRDFWRVSKPGRMLGQFGVCFGGGVVRPCSGPVIRRRASMSCSPPPPHVSTREVSSPVQSPPKSLSPSSSISELHFPPSAEMHPSTSPSRLFASSSPLSHSSNVFPSTSKTHREDSWILCEEPNPEEPEPVLPAFAILAELASGLGLNLGMLNMNMNAIGLAGPASISGGGDAESPLSPTEAEMFRVLCVCPD